MYELLKRELKLCEDQIAFNLKLKSKFSNRTSDSDNEIDVAFVYENTLYIMECKVFTQRQLNSKKITDAIYKISSIRQSMGLKATAAVAILSPFGKSVERTKSVQSLMEMARVKAVFSLENMEVKEEFIKEIRKLIKS